MFPDIHNSASFACLGEGSVSRGPCGRHQLHWQGFWNPSATRHCASQLRHQDPCKFHFIFIALHLPNLPQPQNNVVFFFFSFFFWGGGCMWWGRGCTGTTLSTVDLSLRFIIVMRMVVTGAVSNGGVVSHNQYPHSEGSLKMLRTA